MKKRFVVFMSVIAVVGLIGYFLFEWLVNELAHEWVEGYSGQPKP